MVRFRPEAPIKCGCSSSGRAPPCQGGGSGFEPRHPLQRKRESTFGTLSFSLYYSLFIIHYSFRRQAFDISQIITNSLCAIGVPLCFGSEGLFFRSGYKKRLLGSEKKHLNIHTYYIDKMKKHAKMTKIKKCI